MICCQDTELVTITAHDGDASINEDIVMSVDDQSECKIYLVYTYLLKC